MEQENTRNGEQNTADNAVSESGVSWLDVASTDFEVPTNASIIHTSLPATPQPTENPESETGEYAETPSNPIPEEPSGVASDHQLPPEAEDHESEEENLDYLENTDGFETRTVSEGGTDLDIRQPEKRTVLYSDLTKWKNKKYMGGFRKKQTEYFHAEAQTTTPQEIQASKRKERFHRDCQTVFVQNERSQTVRNAATQMTKSGCYVTKNTDYVLRPKKYQTADEIFGRKAKSAVTIQCFVRCFIARKRARDLYTQREEKQRLFKEKEQRRLQLLEKKRIMENERRLHPKTTKDFEILYSGLENWRNQETQRINKMKLIEPARLAALADLLDQESALLQKIDKLKLEANVENRERGIVRFLEKISSPKKWLSGNNTIVHVDTPNIIRARELRDLFHALNFPMLTVDERLQILLHVKFTVKEFDCNLSREIVNLIDREGDLISRGRGEDSLEGLRKRISNLFLQFIQTPEFNPEVANHVKVLFPNQFAFMNNQPLKDHAVYYCRGCTKYKSSTEFYLSTTMKHLGKCKECSLKENLAVQKTDDASYGQLLRLVRLQEQQKRPNAERLCLSLLQESDIRYLVDVIWNHKSAISGVRNLDDLTLTRWNVNEELTPWNCILLTKSEAITHDLQSNPEQVYSIEFRNKVFQKQLVARQHFAMLPKMAEYLKEHYAEKDGKLVAQPQPIEITPIPNPQVAC